MNNDLQLTLKERISAKQQHYVELLKSLCDIHCGSEMVEGVNKVVEITSNELQRLGFSISKAPGGRFADHLIADNQLSGKQIVLGGHLDTTYMDYSELPKFHISGDKAIGPGTADMKGGIVVFLAALDCLKEQGLLDSIPITAIFNSDEERGAPSSRKIFQEHAKNCRFALFSECAGKNNEIVVSRRGKLSYKLGVNGIVEHAGKRGGKVSALEEVCHKIIAVEKLNGDYPEDSFNVGRAWGGIASNTIPGQATALIDVRFTEQATEYEIKQALEMICRTQYIQGTSAELEETSYRPVWERSPDQKLMELVKSLASELGQSVDGECRGGTADVNWFGAVGVPSLDGLGPIGFDDHTPAESIILPTLFERALLTANLLLSLKDEG